MAVVVNHLYGNLQTDIPAWLATAVGWLLARGYLGVSVFFVLSGYVITLNVGKVNITPQFIGRFALRRAIRLDPPYWVSIVVAIALSVVAVHLFPDLKKTYPSVGQVLAHLVYLQDILGFGDIVPIYWTLCLEVQFYLFLVMLLYGAQKALGKADTAEVLAKPIVPGLLLLVAVLSLAQFFDWVKISPRGVFLPYWFSFSLGMFCVWAVSNWVKSFWFALHWGVVLLWSITSAWNETGIVAALTAGLLYVAGKKGKLQSWTLGRPTQYLGRISYSLYLFHGIVGWSTVSILKRFASTPLGAGSAGLIFFAGIVASIVTAHIFYLAVERPSIQLSHRIRRAIVKSGA